MSCGNLPHHATENMLVSVLQLTTHDKPVVAVACPGSLGSRSPEGLRGRRTGRSQSPRSPTRNKVGNVAGQMAGPLVQLVSLLRTATLPVYGQEAREPGASKMTSPLAVFSVFRMTFKQAFLSRHFTVDRGRYARPGSCHYQPSHVGRDAVASQVVNTSTVARHSTPLSDAHRQAGLHTVLNPRYRSGFPDVVISNSRV
jgi:hypothetical protein